MKKQKGMALISVIVMLAVVILFTASISAIFSQDLRETVNQEKYTKAYYLALSGIELGEAALMTESAPGKLYIEEFKGEDNKKFVTHPKKPSDSMSFGDGKIKIEMGIVKVVEDGSEKKWIQIHSTGILDSDGTTTNLYKLIYPENNFKRALYKTGLTYEK